eukprot:TRINITY_DN4790_c1_g1_i1.p1 TRINITY_DN4790_c1_g1~~TRINITY_DN4790_c1_g1_i1.p1  ORF type:complete len:881 (+),score=176.84 TRINITY_DN4790_c1_g1_i1:272-2644(+)
MHSCFTRFGLTVYATVTVGIAVASLVCSLDNYRARRRSKTSNFIARHGGMLMTLTSGFAASVGPWWVLLYVVHYYTMLASWISTQHDEYSQFVAEVGGLSSLYWMNAKSIGRAMQNALSLTVSSLAGLDSTIGTLCGVLAGLSTVLNVVWRTTITPAGTLAELLQKLLKCSLVDLPCLVVYTTGFVGPGWGRSLPGHGVATLMLAAGAAAIELCTVLRTVWDFFVNQRKMLARHRELLEEAALARDFTHALAKSDYHLASQTLSDSGSSSAASAGGMVGEDRANNLREAFSALLSAVQSTQPASYAGVLGVLPQPAASMAIPGVPKGWKRVRNLGSGAFGDVWQGMRPDGTVFALKYVRLPSDPERPQQRARDVLKEVHVMNELSHPHIVQYYGCDYDASSHALVIFMEFVDGGSLGALARNLKSIEEATAALWIRQTVLGIQYLHERKIIHRDLKGDNLLLSTRDGIVKVSDFGTSRHLGATVDGRTAAIGTPLWMAPEVFKGQYTYTADIWSLGICVCELLASGRPPWPSFENVLQSVYTISQWRGTLPPQVPEQMSPECTDFLKRCLAPDPDTRASTEELLQHLFLTSKIEPSESSSLTIHDVIKRISDHTPASPVSGGPAGSPQPLSWSETAGSVETVGISCSGGTTAPTLGGSRHSGFSHASTAPPKDLSAVEPDRDCVAFECRDRDTGNVLRFSEGETGSMRYTVNGESRPHFSVIVCNPAGDRLRFRDIDRGCALPQGRGLPSLLGKFMGLAERTGVQMYTLDMNSGGEMTEGFPAFVSTLTP